MQQRDTLSDNPQATIEELTKNISGLETSMQAIENGSMSSHDKADVLYEKLTNNRKLQVMEKKPSGIFAHFFTGPWDAWYVTVKTHLGAQLEDSQKEIKTLRNQVHEIEKLKLGRTGFHVPTTPAKSIAREAQSPAFSIPENSTIKTHMLDAVTVEGIVIKLEEIIDHQANVLIEEDKSKYAESVQFIAKVSGKKPKDIEKLKDYWKILFVKENLSTSPDEPYTQTAESIVTKAVEESKTQIPKLLQSLLNGSKGLKSKLPSDLFLSQVINQLDASEGSTGYPYVSNESVQEKNSTALANIIFTLSRVSISKETAETVIKQGNARKKDTTYLQSLCKRVCRKIVRVDSDIKSSMSSASNTTKKAVSLLADEDVLNERIDMGSIIKNKLMALDKQSALDSIRLLANSHADIITTPASSPNGSKDGSTPSSVKTVNSEMSSTEKKFHQTMRENTLANTNIGLFRQGITPVSPTEKPDNTLSASSTV